ncbi:MBL fold metallo-hydrolase [Paramagnetospirillum magneticum]|uniref:MBL fold metallo-hydrolase n=1 Tax=Paramagnetospirillum magneticum TaxID=84159 RepID=UPI000A0228B6|nr:MBL fold metallo-hydrolase [Paramagnetospirillum magneticum]
MDMVSLNIDYDRPVKIAENIYWVGFADSEGRLQCNPYLIIDGDEAMLIDGGSRPDFSTVMRKVLQTGISLSQIRYLVYQHYDPDLCGSIPNLESIINTSDLKIISHAENNPFIRHYAPKSPLLCIDKLGGNISLRSGRVIRFFRTPYAHSAGSFITYDQNTGVLFTSDLFGSAGAFNYWKLFATLDNACSSCIISPPSHPDEPCSETEEPCPWTGMHSFHRRIMPGNKQLHHAMGVIETIGARIIAPQHGSILYRPEDISAAIDRLKNMDDIGIDGILPPKRAFK